MREELINFSKLGNRMNSNLFDIDNQCELSYELLHLLKWLIEHESPTLKKMVARALRNGLREELHSSNAFVSDVTSEAVQTSIVDFLDLIDALLHETISESSIKRALEQNLMPAINKIDSTICDKATLQGSLDKTTDHLEHHPNANGKELLFKEILKRWKPNTKKMKN